MPFDGLFLSEICRELNEKLCPGRIEKIYQPAREEIILIISRPGAKHRLLLSANAENARAHITRESTPNPTMPPMFCMLLRKHLEGGRIRHIHQPGLERVLDIQVDCSDEVGRPVVKSLVCEIMGRHSNIILVSRADNTIIDGIRRYGHAVSRHREVLPGQPYIPPPHPDKRDLTDINEETFRETILGGLLEDPLDIALQKSINGLSIPTSREIIKLTGLHPQTLVNHCGEHELRTVWQALQGIIARARNNQLQPVLVCDPRGIPVDFFPIIVTPEETMVYITAQANETADAFYTHKRVQEALRQQRNILINKVGKEIKRLHKKLAAQKKSFAEAESADRFRLYGELLTANLYRIERGMREISLENYHDPDLPMISIPLKPERSGSENAQAYFKKYNKARNTRKAAGMMARQTEEELQYLEGIAASLELADNTDELEEIRRELMGQGYIKQQASQPGKKKEKGTRPTTNPLRYVSSDGVTVLVGKNNRQNDMLTMKMADNDDIWLHTSKIPGSHVIIRAGGREITRRTLVEAATLAAYYSRARESSNVPVDYTLRKHVKKPNGAKPGYVIYEKQKTLFVNPAANKLQPVHQEPNLAHPS